MCLQIEATCPEAYIAYKQLAAIFHASAAGQAIAAQTAAAIPSAGGLADGVAALPVIMVAHCWENSEAADPNGATFARLAAQLARDMPTFNAWGFDDVGVFFEYARFRTRTQVSMRALIGSRVHPT